jgi:4-alpha-glucanotransferase
MQAGIHGSQNLSSAIPEALAQVKASAYGEIFYYKFVQFEFFRQWSDLKSYANMRGIDIIGDIPIYVAHDSADVWAHPDIFCLDEETGVAAQMAGVPTRLL